MSNITLRKTEQDLLFSFNEGIFEKPLHDIYLNYLKTHNDLPYYSILINVIEQYNYAILEDIALQQLMLDQKLSPEQILSQYANDSTIQDLVAEIIDDYIDFYQYNCLDTFIYNDPIVNFYDKYNYAYYFEIDDIDLFAFPYEFSDAIYASIIYDEIKKENKKAIMNDAQNILLPILLNDGFGGYNDAFLFYPQYTRENNNINLYLRGGENEFILQ